MEKVGDSRGSRSNIETVEKKRSKRKKNNRHRSRPHVRNGEAYRFTQEIFWHGRGVPAWFRNREFAITVHEVASGQSRWAEGRSRIISCGSRHRWLNREKSFIKATADENRIAKRASERERKMRLMRARVYTRSRMRVRACTVRRFETTVGDDLSPLERARFYRAAEGDR